MKLIHILTSIAILVTVLTIALVYIKRPSENKVEQQPLPKKQRLVYTNESFNVAFNYPNEWQGPEVYENSDGFRFEIGTDNVYPYGTDVENRTYTKENSYYIVAQFNKKPAGTDQNSDASLQQYNTLRSLKDGEIVKNTRGLTTKVRNIDLDGVAGVEFISTLSETAQTDYFYAREAILINPDGDILSIMGSANNVAIEDKTNWKKYYEAIDAQYLSTFSNFVNSASF